MSRPQASKTTSRKNPASWEGHWRVIQTPSTMSIWAKSAAVFPYSGHHGLLGAAAGCAIGRHEANKRDRLQKNQIDQPNRDLRNGEERL